MADKEQLKEKSYADSLASDIFHMIEESRENGLDLDNGFENRPYGLSGAEIVYYFQPKKGFDTIPLPMAVKKKLGVSNVLVALETEQGPIGMFLVCSSPVKFSAMKSESPIAKGMQKKAVNDFKEAVAGLMRLQFDQGQAQ